MDEEDVTIKSEKDSINISDEEKRLSIENNNTGWRFWKKRRYIIGILAFFGYFTSTILRVNLSIAIVAMTTGSSTKKAEFVWDSKTIGFVLASFFYGYTCTQFIGGWLSARIGGKRVFGYGIGIASLLTLFTPPLTRTSVYLLITLRVAEGIFEGVSLPSVHAILANWSPPLERSRLTILAYSGGATGMVAALPVSGFIAEHLGWPYLFYIYGFFGIIWFGLWMYIVSDTPSDDPRISSGELAYIRQTLDTNNNKKVITHPWKSIFQSPAVWAIFAAHFSETWGYHTMVTQLPTLIHDVMDFKIQKTGFISAIPYLATVLVMAFAGHFADYLLSKTHLTTTQVRKILTSGAFLVQAIFMTTAGFITHSTIGIISCIIISFMAGGLSSSGFLVNYLDIAPQHASVLMGMGNTIGAISGIISPSVTGYIVKNKSSEEWKIVLIIVGVNHFLGALIYGLFASGEKQKWAMDSHTEKSSRKFLQKNDEK